LYYLTAFVSWRCEINSFIFAKKCNGELWLIIFPKSTFIKATTQKEKELAI